MEEVERYEAEKAYVEAIMERGNPRYFIYRAIERWTLQELEEDCEDMGLEFDIYEEE